MKKKIKRIIGNFVMIFTIIWIFSSPALADKATLVGEVNDNQEIVAEDQIYTVGDSAVGDDLVHNYISQRVKVVGREPTINNIAIIGLIGAYIIMILRFVKLA